MKVHAISTGTVTITRNWQVGKGQGLTRLVNTLLDRNFTEPLPIFCWVIEHQEGLIVVDTGIPANANDPILFPPHMALVQRAARFQITPEQEIGPQMQQRGLSPDDVRWVVLTHLHQDHEGGLQYFPHAEIMIARAEWQVAQGFAGRMGGYLNIRWPHWLAPTLIDFDPIPHGPFPGSYPVTSRGDVFVVPTPGHSVGHQSIVIVDGEHTLFIAGDTSYTQDLLLANQIDGIGSDPAAELDTHRRIMDYAASTNMIYLPSHEWDAERRLKERDVLRIAQPLAAMEAANR